MKQTEIQKIKTLGQLKASGWKSRSVKDELRENLIRGLQSGEPLFPGILGYEQTVLPQIQNALIAKHDFILLGLRGQAKTQLIRQLPRFLDEYSPTITGTALNEDPYQPISPQGIKIVKEKGEDTPISWMSRDERFHEKLATPDVSMNDLIGDIDPIKAAREKLDISNPDVIHWGIIPRTNRGIFAINEIPDLQPRIQVGLLNILEESDIQVRGFPIRVPMDVCLVFTANPEDYTNRGTIITPLKDRIDSQIITHYPPSLSISKQITHSQIKSMHKFEAPDFYFDIIETISFQARKSEYIDQTSGVSTRLSISALENIFANIERREVLNEEKPFPRIMDIYAAIPAITGKIELVHEGDQAGPSAVAANIIGGAIQEVFFQSFPKPSKKRDEDDIPQKTEFDVILEYFKKGDQVVLDDRMKTKEYNASLDHVKRAKDLVKKYLSINNEKELYLGIEFLFEGLHYAQMISRKVENTTVKYLDVYSGIFKGFN